MSFGNILKKVRIDNNYTQEELAKKINTSRSNIANYENEKNMPSIEVLNKLSHVLGVSIDYLLGKSDNIKSDNSKVFILPILGKISAGLPIFAEQQIEGYLPIDPNIYSMSNPEEYFYLRVSGESMNLKIHNGDYALIQKQDTAEDGDIVVAFVNGDEEATLKRYKRISEDTVALEPMSTLPMEPIYVNLKETSFKIIGKAIGQFGKF